MSEFVPILESLGVEIVSDEGKEIKGLCPVHKLATGREDEHPSWYMNAVTGAWICFSCKSKGSLHSLVETLGGDITALERIEIEAMKSKVGKWTAEPEEEDAPTTITPMEARAFNRLPFPGPKARADRDLDKDTCELLNIRWKKEDSCFMLPIYSFDMQLLGWQEKGFFGHFNNYPKGMKRSQSLFGFHAVDEGVTVALVESPLDAARFWRYEMPAVAVYGSYTSADQLAALSRVADRVVVAFDNDKAGHTGTAIASRMLTNLGTDVRFFDYGVGNDGRDPGDLRVGQLIDGFENASAFAPAAITGAAEELRKQPYKKKSEDTDPLTAMRTWAANARRSATT